LGQRVLQHFLVLACSAQPCTSGVVPLTTLQKRNKKHSLGVRPKKILGANFEHFWLVVWPQVTTT
jgi:hypothetical protein